MDLHCIHCFRACNVDKVLFYFAVKFCESTRSQTRPSPKVLYSFACCSLLKSIVSVKEDYALEIIIQ